MARHIHRLVWLAVAFLATTLVFLAILQEASHESVRPWEGALWSESERHAGRAVRNATQRPDDSRNSGGVLRLSLDAQSYSFYRLRDGNFSAVLRQTKLVPVSGGVPDHLRVTGLTDRLWPLPGDQEDRILAQINHIPSNPHLTEPQQEKIILVYDGLPSGVPDGNRKFLHDSCPVSNCRLSEDHGLLKQAHAVLFQSGIYAMPSLRKRPGQIWVFYCLEAPENYMNVSVVNRLFNWTATYRRDSTLTTPYERFVTFANTSSKLPPVSKNYAARKTHKVAWFVSNCYAANGRLDYAKELAKHIDVDIYGDCGTLKCQRHQRKKCDRLLSKNYKFYLAFENSNCRDYITEKFYWNGLLNDVIPIAMGARPEDYAAVAPPHSYIHVDEFPSPRHLADYLHVLDQNDTLYNEYFRWKGSGEFVDTKFWCRLCSMLHEADNQAVRPQDKFASWFEDVDSWFAGPGTCVKPRTELGLKWSSWLNMSSPQTRANTLRYGPYPTFDSDNFG